MAAPEPKPLPARRGRGNRAGLTAARIVAAARTLEPEKVTVKAVADRLGVDRAAVHHHVSDLNTLRELVALDAFAARLAPVVIPPGADWPDACRLLAVSMYDAVLASEGFGVYVRLTSTDVALLEPVEHTLRIMLAAGFDQEAAARFLATLATLAGATARERLLARRPSGHPQPAELHRALEDRDAELPLLRRIADAPPLTFDEAQLHAGVDLLLDGMARRLPQ
ncbi:hypothetical protein GCM10023328_17140 [Modestobacter marinus]|uniref:AcrR family transcriptional regulator n=1 Tax=Modestobacter marinus TaxID=477641 RepID=A0A846LLH5_9ACTN|nr:TetR/AcrR family transcriptional regulator C-terminal domain-containing protein [Modestobacter marinus]NIH68231.1 AcrR family transcriptional regulator [Modestobacter marinus]GGL79392.1 hypothetical protein GCM10011589_39400 [Modestobacter marinus]